MITILRMLPAVLLLGVMAHGAEVDQAEFRYRRDVEVPTITDDSLIAVTLDAEVYSGTRDGLPDLQLRSADGELVAYIVRQAKAVATRTERRTWKPTRLSAKPIEEGDSPGLEIVVHLEKDDPDPNGLSLITPLRNFEQRVRVQSSPDGESWQPLGAESLVFDYSQYIDVKNAEIRLPETTDRHFRILIDDVTIEQQSQLMGLTRRLRGEKEEFRDEQILIKRAPFRINRVEFWRESKREIPGATKYVAYPPVDYQVTQDTEQGRTLVLVTTRREPLKELKLVTSSRNFSRQAAVQVPTGGRIPDWRDIGSGKLTLIDFQGFERKNLRIDFPESRHREYRLVIENQDNSPLEVTGIEPRGAVHELVFVAKPNSPYALFYGNSQVAPPNLDTAVIRELLSQGFDPQQASLAEQAQVIGVPPPAPWWDLLSNPALLFTVACVLVVLLGFGLYQATKRVDQLTGDPSEHSP